MKGVADDKKYRTHEMAFFGNANDKNRSRAYGFMLFKLSHFLKHLGAEMLGNSKRFFELVRNCTAAKAATLTIVKLMDYSDHLPQLLSPKPLLVSSPSGPFEDIVSEHIRKLKGICAQTIEWAFNPNVVFEISYNASLGDAEVHPHIVHIVLRELEDKRLLHFRYFDDESTVWQGNPCRASTVTLADLIVDLDRRELYTFRYLRFRSPKRAHFNRRETLVDLHALLDSPAPFLGLDIQRITFGVEISANCSQLICRYAMKPKSTFRTLITSSLLRAQLSIVTAITRENVAFTNLGLDKLRQFARGDANVNAFPNRARVLKMQYGKKQLRMRTLQ